MSTLNVLEHSPNLVHLALTQDQNVLRYELRAARTLDDAYVGEPKAARNGVAPSAAGGGTDLMFEVTEGYDFRSTGLKRKKLGMVEESNRGMTVVKYDPDEFVSQNIPPDRDFAYVTVREYRRGLDDFAPEDEIHIIPAPDFYSMRQPILNIAGTAPLIAATAAGSPPPPESMIIVLPKYMGSFTLNNTGTNPIFTAYERRMPMREIPAGEILNLTGTEQNLLILAATTGATTFSLSGSVQNAAF